MSRPERGNYIEARMTWPTLTGSVTLSLQHEGDWNRAAVENLATAFDWCASLARDLNRPLPGPPPRA